MIFEQRLGDFHRFKEPRLHTCPAPFLRKLGNS